jgi:two-component system, cell cycle sensor histidine kinase and response regulator CckA
MPARRVTVGISGGDGRDVPHIETVAPLEAGERGVATGVPRAMMDTHGYDGRDQLALLARMTSLFASGLDRDATLQGVVDLFVPDFATWASIDVLEGGALRRLAASALDFPEHTAVFDDLRRQAPELTQPTTQRILALEHAEIAQIESPQDYMWPARSEAHDALYRSMLPLSVIVAPLRAHGETMGFLQLVVARGTRRFASDDARLVEDVAQRAAFAVHTAQLVAALRSELDKRHLAVAQLEASEARYRRMFEGSPFPVWVFDAETLHFLDANTATIREYGYSLDEMRRMTIRDIRPPEEIAQLERSLAESRRGIRESGVFRHQRRDGSTLLVEIRSHDIEFDGRAARVVQGIDVTDRVRAYEAMRVAEERHRLVARVTKEAIWEWNPANSAMVWNHTFYDLFLFDAADVALTREWFESRIHPDDRLRASAELGAAMQGLQEQCNRRFRFQRGDGTVALVEDRAFIAWSGEIAERVIGSLADVTVQHELGEQLAIAQRMEAVGRLAGGVAHDFNNLLTAIRGFASFALDEQLPSSRARDDIEQILQASDRAAALTRQLLAFSRRQVLQPQLVSVNEILGNLQRMLARVLGEDVEVVTAFDPASWPVVVDPGQLEQVIMNLVVNARDAMPEGGLLTIATSNVVLDAAYAEAHQGATAGDHVLITITDTGTGMDARTMERIFEPFFSTKERDKGTGLGLATSYGIIQQSGGHIGVVSAPERGSTFSVYLPRALDDDGTSVRAPTELSTHLDGSETVLVVEDDDRVRRVSVAALQRHGYRVLESRTAEGAIAIFHEHHATIDIVVSDVVLPRKSGPSLVHELRTLRPDLRVLFVSGYTENAFLSSGAVEPGIELLEKPFTPETLARHVRAILDRPRTG